MFVGVYAIVFFMYQAIEHSRSPYSVFFSPLKRREFKILLSMVEKGTLDEDMDNYSRDRKIIIDKKFKITYDWFTERWRINGVRISFFQERALKRTLERRALNVHILSPNGQLIYNKD